ncbi:hypothetical protein ACFV42_46570 [Streptomyces solisilvae]|uniref:hypothetical protein n=1 Tax=Streptomyces malaysiensis TaxID=92644 RepID=UPI0036C42CE5
MTMNGRPTAVERYALKFDREAPEADPTDANLKETLKGCALPPPFRLLEPIRRAVVAYRAAPERAGRIAQEKAETTRAGEHGGDDA